MRLWGQYLPLVDIEYSSEALLQNNKVKGDSFNASWTNFISNVETRSTKVPVEKLYLCGFSYIIP